SDITRRKRAESDLQQAKSNLEGYVNELEQRNREIEMLSAMGGLLQASLTVEEAHGVIAKSIRQLFAEESGAIFLLKGSKSSMESIAVWGGMHPADQVLTPKECWALRLGRVYSVEGPGGMLCPHVKGGMETAYICTPLMAHNETLGLLHLQLGMAWRYQPREERSRLLEHKKRLAITTAESVALSLANFRLREVLYNQSIRDPLTELFNRRYMKEMVEKEVHRTGRRGRPLGIIMLDIDHFKRFNDANGHEAGDILLHELGAFLLKQIREEDLACRYGGEEFVIVMPETTLEHARSRAEQLREGVKSLMIQYLGSVLGPVSLSLGIAGFPVHGSTAEELLRAADAALYQAKAEGRDRVITASPGPRAERGEGDEAAG
ncbi:MAG: sensor domain-containing diguanylate cyclase, partial [Nitrospirales bacterium]|nr:sensor domain-containing diguanylate cyclase [Nitrospirales bacterium]